MVAWCWEFIEVETSLIGEMVLEVSLGTRFSMGQMFLGGNMDFNVIDGILTCLGELPKSCFWLL